MKLLDDVCERIYRRLKKKEIWRRLYNAELLVKLNPGKTREEAEREYILKAIKYTICALFAAILLWAVSMLSVNDPISEESRIAKPKAGEGSVTYAMEVKEENTSTPLDMEVTVGEQKPEGEALEQFFRAGFEKLEKEMLGDNESPDEIAGPLVFLKEVPGTQLQASWKEIDTTYLYEDGSVRPGAVTEPVIIYLSISLKYYDEERVRIIPIRLVPPKKTEAEVFEEKLMALLKSENSDPTSGEYILPTALEGKELSWAVKKDKTPEALLILGLLSSILVLPMQGIELKNRGKKRLEQMEGDYPDIIAKYVMLLSAGMTCKAAWNRICDEYTEKKIKMKNPRYAYEEMLIAQKEFVMGIPERRVYENFGINVGSPHFRRFAGILERNLKRGSADMIRALEQEAAEAISMKRNAAAKKAEEAGTKLLIPMAGMFGIVVAIIVVPAFLSF